MEIVCPQCGDAFYRPKGEVNRAARIGAPLFCTRTCSGLARRKNRTDEERRALKADYDKKRREELGESLLAKKRKAYHEAVAKDPETVRLREKLGRLVRRKAHLEYCRRPEYREWKSSYDRQYRAQKEYGPFAEAFLVLRDLETTIRHHASRYEIDLAAGRLNKVTRRKRDYAKAVGC